MGVVRARGGVGTHWQPLNTFSPRKCEPSVGSGEEMRARWGAGGRGGESAGGCGHALACLCEPGLCSGEETRARGGVGGGGGEGAGGCGHALAALKYSLNIQKMQPGVSSGEAGVEWGVGGGGGEGAGGVGTQWQPTL